MTPVRRKVFVFATVCLVLFAGFLFADPGGAASEPVVIQLAALVASLFATACAVAAAARCGANTRARATWIFLAMGLAGRVLGDLIWITLTAVRHTPLASPSMVDACFLLLPVGACLAALFSPLRHGPRSTLRLILDAVIVSTSLFVVMWSLVLRYLFATGALSGAQFAVILAYPFADLAMLAVALLIAVRARRGFRRAIWLLTLAAAILGLSDAAYFYLSTQGEELGPLVRLGWVTGIVVVGLAGLYARADAAPAPPERRAPSRASFWLPYLPVPFALALGVSSLKPAGGHAIPILCSCLLLIGAALVRQVLLLDENRRLLSTVADLALRDSLTGLANRAVFTDRLADAMDARAAALAPVSVLSVDLDDFKLVNDSLGHLAGDAMLRDVGLRMQQNVRVCDTVARLGGDEFAVLIEDTEDNAREIAQRILRAFDRPLHIEDREVYARLSIGLATAPATGDDDVTASELFNRADLAMYSAKRDKYAGVRTFSSEMRMHATPMEIPSRLAVGSSGDVSRTTLLADLHQAIDEGALTLVYHPTVCLSSGAVVGVEALVRWPHPDLGTLESADFLPLARQKGLVELVDRLVVSGAVRDAATWYADGIEIPVSVNLSAPSLTDETMPDDLLSMLHEHGLTADALTVEITEDLLLASVISACNVMDRLRSNGIRVSIDDFGSSYAAMAYLHRLPIDELKLDRQFIAPILEDERIAAIVRSVIELARSFGVSTVADGVEDRATAQRLAEYGCDLAQGRYYGPPLDAESIRCGTWASLPMDVGIDAAPAARASRA